MTFTTTSFWVFFAGFLPLCLLARGQTRKGVLLASSYVFYGSWDVRFLGLLVASTCLDYYVGRQIGAAADERTKRRWLVASLISNLGILSYFKYANFFVESAVNLTRQLGMRVEPPDLNVVLPVGISFYTFQALSYVIDVYRGKCSPVRSLLDDFATYTAFFPQLVAGPIERATQRHMVRRAATNRDLHLVCVGWALFRAESLSDCVIAFEKLLNPFAFDAADWFLALRKSKDLGRVATLLAGGTLIVALHHAFPVTPRMWIERLRVKPPLVRYALVACFLYAATLLAPEEAPAFIYFQF